MSQSKQRRAARQTKHHRTHDWGDVSPYEAALFALAADELDELAPRPSQHVATDVGSRTPYPAKGRPATTRDRYVYDTGE